jgi:hypothetical protein
MSFDYLKMLEVISFLKVEGSWDVSMQITDLPVGSCCVILLLFYFKSLKE